MTDVTRDRSIPAAPVSLAAPPRPAVAIVPPPGATQVELGETPLHQEARKPDLLHRQASHELADVWGGVAGEEPRKKTRQAAAPRDGVRLPTGELAKPDPGQGVELGWQKPEDGHHEPTGATSGTPIGYGNPPDNGIVQQSAVESRAHESQEALEHTDVEAAGKVAGESAPDEKAQEASTTEGAARNAAAEQAGAAKEQEQVAETRAQSQREEARIESKAAEADRREREVASTETRLHECRNNVSVQARRVQELHGRVREKESQLVQVENDINAISSASDYLEHADEVERLHSMRYFLRVELENEKQAARAAEWELQGAEREAGNLESSVFEGKRSLALQRHQVSKERSTLDSRTAAAETREGQIEGRKQGLQSVESLRPFWAALRDESGFDAIADEAAARSLDLNQRDLDATRRIQANLGALSDPQAALDLVGGLDPSRTTRAEQALANMQLPLEKVRGA